MLVVLAEFDCLEALKERGVHPDKFYTDFDAFKAITPVLRDVHYLFIFVGTSRFNKRMVTDLVLSLQKRAYDDNDTTIKSVTVLCDTTYVQIKPYFKFQGSLDNVERWEGYKITETNVDFWRPFQTNARNTEKYLSAEDLGDTSELIKSYRDRYNSEDELIKRIKVPDVKSLMCQEA